MSKKKKPTVSSERPTPPQRPSVLDEVTPTTSVDPAEVDFSAPVDEVTAPVISPSDGFDADGFPTWQGEPHPPPEPTIITPPPPAEPENRLVCPVCGRTAEIGVACPTDGFILERA